MILTPLTRLYHRWQASMLTNDSQEIRLFVEWEIYQFDPIWSSLINICFNSISPSFTARWRAWVASRWASPGRVHKTHRPSKHPRKHIPWKYRLSQNSHPGCVCEHPWKIKIQNTPVTVYIYVYYIKTMHIQNNTKHIQYIISHHITLPTCMHNIT